MKTASAFIFCLLLAFPIAEAGISDMVGQVFGLFETQRICLDSDGGKYPGIPGSVVVQSGDTKKEFPDACKNSDTQVREYYCRDDGRENPKTYDCPMGCRDGACISQGSCGNGVKDSGEQCDDMNDRQGDGCYNCRFELPEGMCLVACGTCDDDDADGDIPDDDIPDDDTPDDDSDDDDPGADEESCRTNEDCGQSERIGVNCENGDVYETYTAPVCRNSMCEIGSRKVLAEDCAQGCHDGRCIRADCGNSIIEEGEECDSANLGGKTCSGLGYEGGSLGCAGCMLDTAACQRSASGGIWISQQRLQALPMRGAAWDALLADADKAAGVPDLSDQDDETNVIVMAKALAFARTGTVKYRQEAEEAIANIAGSGKYNGRALALGRELAAYVIAADLIDLRTSNPSLDSRFRIKIRELLTTGTDSGPKNLIECHEKRPNNWGTMCGASRIAVAAYLGDKAELDRAYNVFLGYLGDRSRYSGFVYGDLSWQCDPDHPVGINPTGCLIDGHDVGGSLPEEMRRDCSFRWPPCKSGYNWEGLQGALVQAILLDQQGYPVWDQQDKALLRALDWLYSESMRFPAEGDDTWQPYVVNHYYGTDFPVSSPSRAGKVAGYTDWTHA